MILIDTGQSRRGFSRISTFLKCPQLFAYAYGLAGEAAAAHTRGDRAPLIKGSLIHTGLAHYYARIGAAQGGVALDSTLCEGMADAGDITIVSDVEALYEPFEAMRQWCGLHPEGEDFLPLALNCVRGYAGRYADDMDRFRVMAVEREHVLSLGVMQGDDCRGLEEHPEWGFELIYTARIDLETVDYETRLEGKSATGPVRLWDHKTTGYLSRKQAEYYSMHGQFTGIRLWGTRDWGDRFAGPVLNLVQTDGTKFARPPLEPAPGLGVSYLKRLRMAEIERARLELATMRGELDVNEWPAAMQETVCYGRYGRCDAWDLCRWGGE